MLRKTPLFIFVFLIFSLFIFSFVISVSAQTVTPDPREQPVPPTESSTTSSEFTTDPKPQDLNANYVNINLIFSGLQEDQTNYRLCTGSQKCLSDNPVNMSEISQNLVAKDGKVFKTGLSKVSPSEFDFYTSGGPKEGGDPGVVKIVACGDGKEKVKVFGACKESGAPTTATGDKNGDYFWPGQTYYVSLGVVNDDGTVYTPLKKGWFFIQYAYPTLQVVTSRLYNGGTLQLLLKAPTLNGGGDRNNYKVSVKGGEGYSQQLCVPDAAGKKGKDSIWQVSASNNSAYNIYFNDLTQGKYDVNLEVQNKDSGGFLGTGIGGEDCSGGFDYYSVSCDVKSEKAGGGTCSEPQKDPKGDEYDAMLRAISKLVEENPELALPCNNGEIPSGKANTPCESINTAIGQIRVDDPQSFIGSIFKYVLIVAAFGGTIILIYAGYVFMTSRGDKEKIAGARETLTSAIVGLLFIVLSIVILEIIGVDILQLPGFSR